ncbi:MerR family transcriptional regulator [Actinokineospora xionganensis]|uniref:MerR family transcriptional regulator n=1 Tax=Actinokineospora xionganensis TaxID=2684470 RepID=UPI001C9BE79B|nr:MerR family transcriptional regulator [Actinokineospora xionganensis]
MGRDDALTVEQLAAKAGLPTSTIRMYQTRGLLHPPRREGRTARYDSSHVERLGLVNRLQQRGFSLPAIAELIAARDLGARVGDVLGLTGKGGPDDWVPVGFRELRALVSVRDLRPQLFRRASRMGLIRWERGKPFVRRWAMDSGTAMTEMAMPPREILDAFERLRAQTDQIAADFVDVFERVVWPRLADQAGSDDQLDRVRALLVELTETAQGVVAGALRDSIRDSAETFARKHNLLPEDRPPAWAGHTVPVLAERLEGAAAHADEPADADIEAFLAAVDAAPDGDPEETP